MRFFAAASLAQAIFPSIVDMAPRAMFRTRSSGSCAATLSAGIALGEPQAPRALMTLMRQTQPPFQRNLPSTSTPPLWPAPTRASSAACRVASSPVSRIVPRASRACLLPSLASAATRVRRVAASLCVSACSSRRATAAGRVAVAAPHAETPLIAIAIASSVNRPIARIVITSPHVRQISAYLPAPTQIRRLLVRIYMQPLATAEVACVCSGSLAVASTY